MNESDVKTWVAEAVQKERSENPSKPSGVDRLNLGITILIFVLATITIPSIAYIIELRFDKSDQKTVIAMQEMMQGVQNGYVSKTDYATDQQKNQEAHQTFYKHLNTDERNIQILADNEHVPILPISMIGETVQMTLARLVTTNSLNQ